MKNVLLCMGATIVIMCLIACVAMTVHGTYGLTAITAQVSNQQVAFVSNQITLANKTLQLNTEIDELYQIIMIQQGQIKDLSDELNSVNDDIMYLAAVITRLQQAQPASNNTIIVQINTRLPTSTGSYHISDSMKSIQNLSEITDEWRESCFVQRLTNTTLCYRKVG